MVFRLNVFFDKMFFNKIQISSCLNKKNLLAIVGVSFRDHIVHPLLAPFSLKKRERNPVRPAMFALVKGLISY